jgi:hypothetical protein
MFAATQMKAIGVAAVRAALNPDSAVDRENHERAANLP